MTQARPAEPAPDQREDAQPQGEATDDATRLRLENSLLSEEVAALRAQLKRQQRAATRVALGAATEPAAEPVDPARGLTARPPADAAGAAKPGKRGRQAIDDVRWLVARIQGSKARLLFERSASYREVAARWTDDPS